MQKNSPQLLNFFSTLPLSKLKLVNPAANGCSVEGARCQASSEEGK
jgi:hypothetical protein